MLKMYLKAKHSFKQFLKQAKEDESGLATLEIVLIIIVIVALAGVFRDGITEALKGLIEKVQELLSGFSGAPS